MSEDGQELLRVGGEELGMPQPPPINFGSDEGIIAADPLMALADAAVIAAGGVSAGAVREILFLRVYLGDYGYQLTRQVLELKLRQNTGTLRRLATIINAMSLKDLWQRLNINVGGK